MSEQEKINNYDDEPVYYCPKCYSLKIIHIDDYDYDCCGECGCPDIAETDIHTWEKLYNKRYGHNYVVRTGDPKTIEIYNMSVSELKDRVCEVKNYKSLIRKIYPNFPSGYSIGDSITLFFDKLIKDGKLNDLRNLLINEY